MGETFYGVLGVGREADSQTIRRAYRDHVKETHPDVNDSPEAPRRFKRITTARDVLLDGDERARYDRLGHDEYVCEHVTDSAWGTGASTNAGADGSGDDTGSSGPQPSDERTDRAATGTERGRHRRSTAGKGSPWRQYATDHRTTRWNAGQRHSEEGTDNRHTDAGSRYRQTGVNGRQAGFESRTTGRGRATSEREQSAADNEWAGTDSRSRTDGGYTTESWQTASQAYRRSPVESRADTSSSLWETLGSARELGPWLVVHVVLVASALATSWFTFTASAQYQSITTVLFGLVLVTSVITLSMIHVMVRVYA